VKVRELNL